MHQVNNDEKWKASDIGYMFKGRDQDIQDRS